MMYILYGGRYTRALMTEMVLLEGEIPYELRAVDIVKHEHLQPEFLAIPLERVGRSPSHYIKISLSEFCKHHGFFKRTKPDPK